MKLDLETEPEITLRAHLTRISTIGRGAAKRRSTYQYRDMAIRRWEKEREKRKAHAKEVLAASFPTLERLGIVKPE